MAACSALQTVLLAAELTDPALPGMPPGPWTRQLPPWLLPRLNSRHIGLLFRAAAELDLALTAWPLPPPTTTADLLVRHTLVRMTELWASRHPLAVDTPTLVSVLQIARSPAELLWRDEAQGLLADPVDQHARGLELLDPGSWGSPLHEPRRDPRVVFRRRMPASPPDELPGRLMVIEFWGHPGRRASAAQSRVVRDERTARRPTGQGFIPTGRPSDLDDLGVWLRGKCTADVWLRWQPQLDAPPRVTRVLLRGLEVDEQSRAWLLVVWAKAVLEVPLCSVAAVELKQQVS
ncbi:hypothetical protein ASG91_00050 [Phycicoccus sp. Soil802]|nr:hypothetical protein ASG91_00050 [Phycicoccus sp. Soil802]